MHSKFTISESELIEFKKRRIVRNLTNSAIAKGDLVRAECCELCSATKTRIYAHHTDYGNPLNVRWLCSRCHVKAHKPDHPLNPKMHAQSEMPRVCDHHNAISVTVTIPVSTFLALKKASEECGHTVSKLLRGQIQRLYPVASKQMQFQFMENYDKSQNEQIQGIQSVSEDEGMLSERKLCVVPQLWWKGDKDFPRMDCELLSVFEGHGSNAEGVQRA